MAAALVVRATLLLLLSVCLHPFSPLSVSLTATSTAKCTQTPIDIRRAAGVRTDQVSGSRAEYNPFPRGFTIGPGHSIRIEFRSSSSSGLIFLAENAAVADMVSVYLRKGLLAFARRCRTGRAFEVYRKQFNDGYWHSLTYFHDDDGGQLLVDGKNAFRRYRIGPCSSFSSVLFGGMTIQMSTGEWTNTNAVDHANDAKESEAASRHRFSGCLRNLRFDGKVPVVHPHYFAVSECEEPPPD